jgi:hypothetical protein
MRTVVAFAALILLPTPLLAVEATFAGSRPEALGTREVKVDAAAIPWEPVVIEYPDAATALVRLAKDDEDPTPAKPFYRFEWSNKEKTSVKIFAVTPQAEIDRLRKLNDASTATSAGKALETSIISAYTNKYAVIRNCMAGDKDLPEAITMYVTLTPGQAQPAALVVPESSVADCVLAAKERGEFPPVKEPTTARFRLALSR